MYDYDAIIVGSGAAGGALAYKLCNSGRKVALFEMGGAYSTGDFTRFELTAYRNLWSEPKLTSNFELTGGKLKKEVALGMGVCVGGSTTIFTAVAQRAFPENIARWYKGTKVVNEEKQPISIDDLEENYRTVERETSVKPYTDWDKGVQLLSSGFSKIGIKIEPVNAYITQECDHSGCLFGCPTGAKKGSLLAYIIPALYNGLELHANCFVKEVLFRKKEDEDGRKIEAYGVRYVDKNGNERKATSKVVILSAGALETPLILFRSNYAEKVGYSKSSEQVGKNLAANTAMVLFGVFDEVLNNWDIHPLSAHLTDFALEEKGGFLLEMSETMEGPLGFSEVVTDESGIPLVGERLQKAVKNYKRVAGIFINIHDSNDGAITWNRVKNESVYFKPITLEDENRFEKAVSLSKEAMNAAGAKEFYRSVYLSHHVQGTCRIGEDREKSVANSNFESHDCARLFICDGSSIPSVLDINPSLTIYALADRLAKYLNSERCKYLT
jgi:choline dehydrogenase-like flavoprotein